VSAGERSRLGGVKKKKGLKKENKNKNKRLLPATAAAAVDVLVSCYPYREPLSLFHSLFLSRPSGTRRLGAFFVLGNPLSEPVQSIVSPNRRRCWRLSLE
jgi:hypothetical protein